MTHAEHLRFRLQIDGKNRRRMNETMKNMHLSI
jgi:hypothetical protein